jgi:hypothetical protein
VREAVTGVLVAVPFLVGAASGTDQGDPRPAFRFEDPAIVESSGLVVSDGLVVTVNDSGDGARLFTVDPATGETVGTTRWDADATDIEALAPAGEGEVWVADIGDNAAGRDEVTVIRVPVGPGDRTVEATPFRLQYAGGPTDAEALLAHPATGRLYVVTKGVFGGVVHAAPAELRADAVNRLRPLGRVMPVVTDGTFLPDGDHLVLRDYTRAVVYDFPGLDAVEEVALPAQQQGEGIAATGEGTLLVSSEGQRAPAYEVALPDLDVEEEPTAPSTLSREGRELPEEPGSGPDPRPWLIGLGLGVASLVVLWLSLRSPPHHPR